MLKQILVIVLVVLALSGCSKAASKAVPTSTPIEIPSVEPSQVAVTPQNLIIVTPTNSASPTPFTEFTVNPAVDNLKIRVNPGMLFEALILAQQTDTLKVLGTAPGNEWTYIQTEAGVEGWVFTLLLKSSVDLTQIPVRQPKNVQLIKGRVLDAGGKPIKGVGFEVSLKTEGETTNNVVTTDANGMFYAFMPETASGAWTVTQTAISCDSNVWSDNTCSTYKSGYTGNVDPLSQTVTLPQNADPLAFTWK